MTPEPIEKLRTHLAQCPDSLVCATADCLLFDWRESLPEIPAPRLARVLLVAYASANTVARHQVEVETRGK